MIDLFGAALDPDEGAERIALKRRSARRAGAAGASDPYDVLAPALRRALSVRDLGKIATPSWLTPAPRVGDLDRLTAASFGAFVRSGGCREYAATVSDFVRTRANGAPLMIGIDHSTSGGVIEALAERYGPDELAVIVLDSHLDAVPEPLRKGLLEFARDDPELAARVDPDRYTVAAADSPYDCGSFLHDLLARGVVAAANVAVLGAADLPDERLFASDDPRVRRFIAGYRRPIDGGMVFLPREVLAAVDDVGALVRRALGGMRGKCVYLSIDMDVGAGAALTGVRYLEPGGLGAGALLALVDAVFEAASTHGNRLVGCDLMEFDCHRAGAGAGAGNAGDPTYDLARRFALRAVDSMRRGPQ